LKEIEWVRSEMQDFDPPWFFCGGWAVDLWLGKKTRDHADIEIGVFREDQLAIQAHFDSWDLNIVENGVEKEWLRELKIQLPLHEIQATNGNKRLEILLNEKKSDDENVWAYRRDELCFLRMEKAVLVSVSGFPYLAPEIVLLYKSKASKEKDQLDFDILLPTLSEEQKGWLMRKIEKTAGNEHPWLKVLV